VKAEQHQPSYDQIPHFEREAFFKTYFKTHPLQYQTMVCFCGVHIRYAVGLFAPPDPLRCRCGRAYDLHFEPGTNPTRWYLEKAS
jgi:hypothetical protein